MKKRILIILAVVSVLSLSGCARVDQYLGEKMLQQSGSLDDANYIQYRKLSEEGKLDADGYAFEESDEVLRGASQIKVTFSNNNYLDIRYYTNKDCKTEIDVSNCNLNPGDTIYAVVAVKDSNVSSAYCFSEFRAYAYNGAGMRSVAELAVESGKGHYALTIPENFMGTDISLVPVGAFQQRVISLKDYYIDDAKQSHDLAGTWSINNIKSTGDNVEINPVVSYIISYEYDSNEYFLLSTSPECYYANGTDGIVIFKQREAYDDTVDYSVELHKYVTVTLVSDSMRVVNVNDGERITIGANNELLLNHLKYGETVTIRTNREWKDLETNRELILTNTEQLSAGDFKYTLTVPEQDGEFVFTPKEYSYAHGTIRFLCFGQTVTETQILAKGTKIYYETESVDTGYWLAGRDKDHYVIVGAEEQTRAALQAIHFTPQVAVTVELPQPKIGGTVTYKLNGREIKEASVATYSGAEITMKFNPWDGWISSITGTTTYRVQSNMNQVANVSGNSVDTILTEDAEHMPKLTLTLEKSVGQAMKVALNASHYTMEAVNYDGGWKVTDVIEDTINLLSGSEDIVSNQKIGTDEPIVIKLSNKAIQTGKAVRMVVEFTDTDKHVTTETRYIDDLSNTLDPVYIYKPESVGTSTVWYKTIHITIGLVNVEKFTQPTAAQNTTITVRNADTNEILQDGALLEGAQKVVVTITPNAGYYLTGNKVKNDEYSETMTFSAFLKNMQEIIAKHPAVKYCTIRLDASDAYASYSYKLDGKEVGGVIQAKEGQKLVLVYQITDSKHQIVETEYVIPIVNWRIPKKPKTEVEEDITVTSAMDGATLTRADFDIEVK